MNAAEKLAPARHPCDLPASELARAIRAQELSSEEVVRAHIARIEQVNPRLNAVVFERFEAALSEARTADQRVRAGGALPPLLGVPITLKDSLDMAGTPSTFGIDTRHTLAREDAAPVRRLREAGAIVLAKSNVAQLLLFLETDNPRFGRTNHPRSNERSSGGSSGGEGALVASGGSALGFGSDLGGSVRNPAAFCGVVGFKPSAGRVPDDGRCSIHLGQRAISSQVGVLARTVDDAALGLSVAMGAGDDGRGPLASHREIELAGLRVALLEDDGILAPCPAARRAVREASALLVKRGARIVEAKLPAQRSLFELFYRIMSADGMRYQRRLLAGSRVDPRIKQLIDSARLPRFLTDTLLAATSRHKTREVVRLFSDGSASAYFEAVEALDVARRQADEAMREVDVIVSPAAALPAVRHGATAELGTLGSYTLAYNVLGFPAGVVPFTEVRSGEESDRPPSCDKAEQAACASERDSCGLPIAVQVAAARQRDHVALAVMRVLEAG